MSLPPPPPPPTCPRHPGREAYRACTRCGRAWCNDCLVQADIGSQCIDCVKQARPPAAERLRRWNATRTTPVTRVLVALNVAVFLYMTIRDTGALGGTSITRAQFDLGLARQLVAQGDWWRMITSGFIHFGIMHLAFNMLALWSLGNMLEPLLGTRRFVLLYGASLMTGAAGVLLLTSQFTITGGASGAIFGLFGAAAVALRQHGINPFRTNIGTVLLINLVLTFSIRGISIGGHLGGLVGGAICGLVLAGPKWKRVPTAVEWAVPLGLIALSLAVGVAVSG